MKGLSDFLCAFALRVGNYCWTWSRLCIVMGLDAFHLGNACVRATDRVHDRSFSHWLARSLLSLRCRSVRSAIHRHEPPQTSLCLRLSHHWAPPVSRHQSRPASCHRFFSLSLGCSTTLSSAGIVTVRLSSPQQWELVLGGLLQHRWAPASRICSQCR
jgi:hypothetical protein